jgi:hypothetical protein
MDRTGKQHMGRVDDDDTPNIQRNRMQQILSKLIAIVRPPKSFTKPMAIDVAPVRRIVVTPPLPKRMVAIVSIGHQTQRRIALGLAITPRLAHGMLRLLGVSGA